MIRLGDDWEDAPYTERNVAWLADSTVELDNGDTRVPAGILLRRYMGKRWRQRGYGARGTWTDDFAFAGSWTAAGATSTWSVGPFRGINAGAAVQRAAASTAIATWTKQWWMTAPVIGFKLGVVDGASSANFSWRVDGGSWTNVSHTWNQNNSLDEITINTAVDSTIEVRGANAAGTNVTMYLVWIEPLTASSGAVLHDLSASGESLMWTNRSEESGDGYAWVDVLQPMVTFVQFTNDLDLWGQSFNLPPTITEDFARDLQALIDRCAPYGKVVPVMYWGQDRTSYDDHGADMQSIIASLAASNSLPHIDLLDRYGDFATIDALGYAADTLHPTQPGIREIVSHNVWPLLARGT